MEENIPYDISDKNIKIKSFNHKTGCSEFQKILSLVYKGSYDVYNLKSKKTGNILLRCSGNHRIWDEEIKKYTHVKDLLYGTALHSNGDIEEFEVLKTDKQEPIVDMQVENNENYFTNDILSHNTGGKALKFYSSVRIEVKRKEYMMEKDELKGIVIAAKTVKNKTAPPMVKKLLDMSFERSFDSTNEWINTFIKFNLVEMAGAGWAKMPDGSKVQGKDAIRAWFAERPEEYEALISHCRELMSSNTGSRVSIDEVDDTI